MECGGDEWGGEGGGYELRAMAIGQSQKGYVRARLTSKVDAERPKGTERALFVCEVKMMSDICE